MNKVYLGLDIGGTKCAALLGRREENGFAILERVQLPTEGSAAQMLEKLFSAAEEIIRRTGEKPAACGISCGGPLNSKTGMILSPPNLPGWDEVPVVKMAEDRFQIPAELQNDANACALAEWMFGAGQGSENMVFLTFGTGMGAGLVLGGKLYDGACGMAGEVGHMRLADRGPIGYGKAGSFEGFCSGGGIADLAKLMLAETEENSVLKEKQTAVTAKDVAEAATAGDALAKKIISVSARHLGKGLALLVDVLNPEKIIIGSIFARCEGLFREEMEAVLHEEALSCSVKACKVVPAGLGERIGDYAALCVAAYGTM